MRFREAWLYWYQNVFSWLEFKASSAFTVDQSSMITAHMQELHTLDRAKRTFHFAITQQRTEYVSPTPSHKNCPQNTILPSHVCSQETIPLHCTRSNAIHNLILSRDIGWAQSTTLHRRRWWGLLSSDITSQYPIWTSTSKKHTLKVVVGELVSLLHRLAETN